MQRRLQISYGTEKPRGRPTCLDQPIGVRHVADLAARTSPLLQQVLRHLYLVRRTGDGYDAVVGAWKGFVHGYPGPGVLAHLADSAAALTDDGSGQL